MTLGLVIVFQVVDGVLNESYELLE